MNSNSPRWARYTRAAVGTPGLNPSEPAVGRFRQWLQRRSAAVRERVVSAEQLDEAVRPRADIRLLPAVGAAWAVAAIATSLPLSQLVAAAAALGLTLAILGMWWTWRHRYGRSRAVLASGPTLALAAACVLAVLVGVALQLHTAATSPIAIAAAQGEDLALTLEVANNPRLVDSGHGPPQVIFDAVVLQATAQQHLLTGRMSIVVFAKPAWSELRQGDRAVTAGKIVPAASGTKAAGLLRPSTDPMEVQAAGSNRVVVTIRTSWAAAVNRVWGVVSPDTAGLLPGMVMGDRNGMDKSLDEAMKTVGLTHLTAVSGANCTLVLATLMVALRTVKAPRLLAVGMSLLGLAGFVLVVGPDPSVMRAAVMGSIGAMAILGGRPKRIGTLLSVAILVLLLADPWLARDYAFILSVLATLGLHLVGQRCVRWLHAFLPVWLAQAVAIPLAAQLFCSPVIVLLQARLTIYTIPANMLVAPVIAIVTTVGTIGMVVAALAPLLASLCAAVSGAGAWWVQAVAGFMSGLPAASLPWPEGFQGMLLMAVFNVVALGSLVALVERQKTKAAIAALLAHVPARWRRSCGFGTIVLAATAVAMWWTAAVVKL
ncbi:competence protein ComEC [Arthrobacter alpinus]|uniref:Competence protein ComEC n=1 Tax=Arthrobacter alpinus TaxID=656366 RepID=A0A1H5JHS0_9MICC|nr:ComEC/Rec2 family competence protein [Arthrobacter alpinus]SEE52000.1 competence protein ComEC [Arthrobacter alpinus]